MHTCPIKIRMIIFTVSIFPVLNLFGFHAARHTGAGYGAADKCDNFSDASTDSNYLAATTVAIGRRADSPITAEKVFIGARSTDSREAVFERGAAGPNSLCARICAYLCCLNTDRETDAS